VDVIVGCYMINVINVINVIIFTHLELYKAS